MEWDQSTKDFVFNWVTVCEMFYGQPEAYYRTQVKKKKMSSFDTDRYHVLIAGLNRKVYRAFFGMDAFSYTDHFREAEQEISALLDAQNVSFITAMLLYDHSKRFAMVFSTPPGVSAQDVAGIVSSCFNRLYARIFDMSNTPYRNYTVLSEEIHGYENLHRTFKEIDALSRQQFFDMQSMIMTPALLSSLQKPADREQIHEDLMQMYISMRAGDIPEVIRRYHTVMDMIKSARDFDLLRDALSSMRTALDGVLRSRGMETDPGDRDIFSVSGHATFELLADTIERRLVSCIQSLEDTAPKSALIQEAVRYIRHHYAEDISVADIAEHIGMSASWLTKRFKQECGCSIVSYLLDVRIERAKALLAETDMLILEVACAVGFDNSRYFISVFKKAVGLTPKAYRDELKA